MIKVLFVCLGNICRSPLAEAIFNHKVKEKGLTNHIKGDSSGTSNYHIGEDPDHRTIQVSVKHDIPIAHKGQQFTHSDGETYDYILAMDTDNLKDIIRELDDRPDSLFLMRDFDDKAKGTDVPDPYYGGADGFENVFQILDRSTSNFLEFIIEKHQLK